MQSRNFFPFGMTNNVITTPIMSQNNKVGGGSIPPPTNSFWVEDLSGNQMVTEDGLLKYVFIGA